MQSFPASFTLKATFDGYSGDQLWLSFSSDNYAILYPSSQLHMSFAPGKSTDQTPNHLQAPQDQFPLAINPKQLAIDPVRGGYATWRDFAFNMQGNPVKFTDDGQLELLDDAEGRRLCVQGDNRTLEWSNAQPTASLRIVKWTPVAFP